MSDTPATINEQLTALQAKFEATYNRPATHAATAPGRVNLIGEHTDYSEGYVLPMAIERQTTMVAAPRMDRMIVVRSTGVDEVVEVSLDELKPMDDHWGNYIAGPIAVAAEHDLQLTQGFDAYLDSTVPFGSGLSSSASLEVATITLIEALTGQSIDPIKKALAAQEAEHRFPNVPCGIMDQFISAMGQEGNALLIDCRSHETRAVPLIDPAITVLIMNSNVKHALTGGEYAERRTQCETAAQTLGVSVLRDATLDQVEAHQEKLGGVVYRRARHVVTENQRTLDFESALQAGDLTKAGQLMFASHQSLRDDFEVSCPELDVLVDLAAELTGTGGLIGSRMTGGGFGGCTVSLVQTEKAERIANALAEVYKEKTGIDASILTSRPAAGAHVLDIN